MAVASVSVSLVRQVSPNRKKIFYQVNDTLLGNVQVYRGTFDNSFDEAADLLTFGEVWEQKKTNQEISESIVKIEAGQDCLDVVNNLDRAAKKEAVKAIIKKAMSTRDQYFIIAVEKIIQEIKTNFTPTQIQNYLGITASNLQKLNTRVDAILSIKQKLIDADIVEVWD